VHNERRPIERGDPAGSGRVLHRPGEAGDFLFTIARHMHQGSAWWDSQYRGTRLLLALDAHFLDAGQYAVNVFVQGTSQDGVGDHEIEAFESGDPGDEIPVGRMEPVGIERAIGDRQHHVAVRPTRGLIEETGAHPRFVETVKRTQLLEAAERGHEEPRLPDEPLGATVVGGSWLQHGQRKPFECIDVLLIPPKRVVEVENLHEQPGPEAKGRLDAVVARFSARHPEKRLAFRNTQHGCQGQQALREAGNQLTRRNHVGQDDGVNGYSGLAARESGFGGRGSGVETRGRRQGPIFDGANEVRRCGPCRHDDEPIASVHGSAVA
jgi:hypothetical protein